MFQILFEKKNLPSKNDKNWLKEGQKNIEKTKKQNKGKWINECKKNEYTVKRKEERKKCERRSVRTYGWNRRMLRLHHYREVSANPYEFPAYETKLADSSSGALENIENLFIIIISRFTQTGNCCTC